MRTEQLYWTIVGLTGKLKTLESYQALLDTLNRDVSNYLAAGLAQRNDLLKVELKQNELQVNRLKLVNGLGLSKRALCQQIGIAYDSAMILTDEPLVGEMPLLSVTPDEAVMNRDEYRLLDRAVEAEALQLKMTQGKLMPQLAVGALAAYADIGNSGNTQKMAFASLSLPLTDWWGGSHKMKQQQLKIDKARNKMSETAELLALQVEQAQNELHECFDQIKLAERGLDQSRENLRITDDNYRSGMIGISDLLEAQALFQSSNDNLINARCNFQVAKATYWQAIGKYNQ